MEPLFILTSKGKESKRTVTLPEEIFGIAPNKHVVYLDVKQLHANQRQGTHKTKEKGEVAASTRKIQKQKGTGNARKGSRKSPLLRGGGTIFGPQPRDYCAKVNKKTKKLARKSALSAKAQAQQIIVVKDFALSAPSTKEYLAFLKALSLTADKVLLVLPEPNQNIYLSARNLPKNKVVVVHQLNTYDLLYATRVVFFESALDGLIQQFA